MLCLDEFDQDAFFNPRRQQSSQKVKRKASKKSFKSRQVSQDSVLSLEQKKSQESKTTEDGIISFQRK